VTKESELENKVKELEGELEDAKNLQRVQPFVSFIVGSLTVLIAYFIIR